MSGLNILIVGASISGPMAAYWLAKGGAKITIIERFPELRTGGQNIDIRLTGVTVMRKIPGMEEEVRKVLAPLDGMALVRKDGSRVAVLKGTGDADSQSLVSEFEIFRGDLSRVIYDLTKDDDNIKYIFDEHIVSMEQHDKGGQESVKVEFANGTPAGEYDLVLACDGATSRTRAMGFGCNVRDHIVPAGAWAAYFSIKSDLLNGDKVGLGYSSPGGRFLCVGQHPSGCNRILAMSIHKGGDDPELEKFRDIQRKGTSALGELKQHVADRFQDGGWKSKQILDELDDSEDFYAAELCQVKIPTLYKGRVVLVGDSGYAAGPTGTGTSMCMAGAYILAGELSRHKHDVEASLKAYDERMKPIIQDMQTVPPGVLSFMGPQTAVGIWMRNMAFASVCMGMRFAAVFSWLGSLWGAASFKPDKYGIPDYEFGI